jgi:hypothetical protein
MSGANIDDLAQFIVQRRNTLDLALRSDLIKLQTQYGSAALEQAIALADRLYEKTIERGRCQAASARRAAAPASSARGVQTEGASVSR